MTRHLTLATIAFALLGVLFSSYATLDFANHLDRQVHGIHCSFLPGVQTASSETSGCQVTLMSRYSSVFRTKVWGGIPVSLPGMALFAWSSMAGGFFTGRFQRDNLASFSSDMFNMPLVVLPRTWVLACLTVVVAALLAALPALRSVAHINLAGAVRERAA